MGWESVYYKPGGKGNSVKEKVFDVFKPLHEAKPELAKNTDLWKNLSRSKMAAVVLCVVKLLDAIRDAKYDVFKDNAAMKELVKGFTSILPATGPVGLTDFASMAADKALEYLELYKSGVEKSTFTKYTAEQKSVISYADFGAHAEMTVSKWAEDMLWTGEIAMEYLRQLGAAETKTTWGLALKESPASKVSEKNLLAIREYPGLRPILYTWVTQGKKTKLSDLK